MNKFLVKNNKYYSGAMLVMAVLTMFISCWRIVMLPILNYKVEQTKQLQTNIVVSPTETFTPVPTSTLQPTPTQWNPNGD